MTDAGDEFEGLGGDAGGDAASDAADTADAPAGDVPSDATGEGSPPIDGVGGDTPVPTGCGAIDELLGGGLERGVVTQVYGPPAAGKTNLALSAAVEVAATGGSAVVVDTEGLSVDRFGQLLEARVPAEAVAETADRVVVSAAMDFDEQAEAVRDAAELAPRAELIVLDSATGFYRLERGNDEGDTLRAVGRQITHLLSLARRHDLAVLITNQVYSDPEVEGTSAKPLGGHTLEHWTGTVLRLDRFRGGRRRATLTKHRSRAAGETAEFTITDAGLESGNRR